MIKKLLIIVLLFLITAVFSIKGVLAQEVSASPEVANENTQAPLKGNATININSDHIEYFQDKTQFVATGNVKLQVEEQDTVVEADKITYDQENDTVIAEKNVKITKDNRTINGDYAKIEINKDSMFINNPNATISQLNIEAKTANIYPKKSDQTKKDIDVLTGKATISDKSLSFILSSSGAKFINNDNLKNDEVNPSNSSFKPTYKVHSKEILIKREKDRDVITLKSSRISINKFCIAKIPSLTLTSDNVTHQIEDNFPEIGQVPGLGGYVGWGPVFNLPHSSTLKVAPIIAFGKGIGVGELSRFTSATNRTEVAYATFKKKIIVKGEQQLPVPTAKIQYGYNSYMENGFLGRQKPTLIIEAVDDRKLASALNFDFNLRSSASYIENNQNWGTGRFQLQGNLLNTKPVIKLGDHVGLGLNSQFDIAVYGTGNTYGVLRAGPTLTANAGPLRFWTAFYQGGIYGDTPFLFDRYYYGKRNIAVNTSYKVNRYVSVGYYSSLNLSKDNWDKKLIAENQIYCWLGPDDLKFRIGYDTKRSAATFDFNMLLGSDRSGIDFDKLKVTEN